MCQQDKCARRGELACVIGDTRKLLCIEHQARYRQAMSCGGRTIVIHHGADLNTWHGDDAAVEDVPLLGLPHEGIATYAPERITDVANSSQYQLGRTAERVAVAEYLRRWEPGLARAIARGDHLEGA